MSRSLFEKMVPSERTVVISLYTPGDKPVPHDDRWGLHAAFAVPDAQDELPNCDLPSIFTMIEYARMHDMSIIVQCDAGLSRSVGVAKAISDCYNLDYRNALPGNAVLRSQLTRFLMRMRGVVNDRVA